MGLFKNRNVFRIAPSDWVDGWMVSKIKGGENVKVNIEQSPYYGEQLVISANQTQGRKAIVVRSDTEIDSNVYLVVVNACKHHIVLTLPPAHEYVGQLHIVCEDPTNGIEIVPNPKAENIIFEQSNIKFNAKGDSITLVSDRGIALGKFKYECEDGEEPPEVNVLCPGTWYAVSRYTANWYA